MANGRITSGGSGPVKTYRRNPDKTITVEGVRIPGTQVTIQIGPPGHGTIDQSTTGTETWSQNVQATLGLHTLIVQFTGSDQVPEKDLRQQINVVDG